MRTSEDLTSSCRTTVLPKQGSIFTFALPLKANKDETGGTKRELTFDIYGDAFAYRSADRVGRKWKAGNGAGSVDLT